MSLASGALVRGRFEVKEVLGTGATGAVHRAFDRELAAEVAVKAVRHASPQALYQLKSEFRALAGVRHDNLVRLGELFGDEDAWFFSMELVRGVDFRSWVRHEAGRFDEARLRPALGQLASGLEALHARGLVHRDVKPSNVLVELETGRVVLLDFGLARVADQRTTASGREIAGTAEFMAPEVAAQAALGPSADWYAAGVMLYEALTGRLPFEGAALEILAQKVARDPEPPSAFADVPPDLEGACLALLAREPESRADGAALRAVAGTEAPRSATLRLPPPALPFVGRTRELDALWRAFEDSRRGRPVVVRVVGESGLGKTALVKRFTDAAVHDEPATLLLEGRCYPHELVPYKAWDGVVDAIARELRRIESRLGAAHAAWLLPREVHALARVFPALRRVPAVRSLVPDERAASASPERQRRLAFEALRQLLGNLGREGPIVVVIDDFHWADRDSRLLLEDLLTAHDAPPLLLVVTERPAAGPDLAVPALRVPVAALAEQDARALARELLAAQQRPEPDDLDAVVRDSGGHPFFLQQLLREAARGDGAVPPLDALLRSRVQRLDARAQRLLEVVCVSGVPLDLSAAAEAASLDVATCRELAEVLEVEQLVRAGPDDDARIQPYHDRVREAVVDGLAPDPLARRHAALAQALATGDDVDADRDVVRHLVEAGQPEEAAAAAELAAARAEQALAFDHASELYRTALSLGRHTPDKRLALRLALSHALANAGRGALEAAQGFLAAADGTEDPDEALTLRTRALEQLAISGHTEQALELLRRLCDAVGVRLPRTRLGTLLSLARRRVQIRLRGLPDALEPFTGEAVAESPTQQLYLAAFTHLPILDPLLANELQARVFVYALDGGELETLGLCLAREAGVALTFNERRSAYAERASRLARQVFARSPVADHRAWLAVGDALRHYFVGELDPAMAGFREAEAIWSSEPRSYLMNVSQMAIFTMGCLRYVGDIEALRRELDRARRDAEWRGNRYLWTLSTIAFQLPVLLQDGLDASRRDFARVDLDSPLARAGANAWYVARAIAEEALYRGAGRDDLEASVRALSRFVRTQFGFVLTWGSELRWLIGRLWLALAEAGDPRGAARAHRVAKQLLRRRLAYAQVWGQALLAGVHAQRGDRASARVALEECAVRGELAGLVLVAKAARVRLGERGLGSAEAHREARAFFDAQRVADLEATLRVFLPGLTEATALPASPRALPAPRPPR
ncbi:MAG: protein kinase [Sandaracinaceae bacterium]|nr:protein kinase [Sandaracinaceae bacterium]